MRRALKEGTIGLKTGSKKKKLQLKPRHIRQRLKFALRH